MKKLSIPLFALTLATAGIAMATPSKAELAGYYSSLHSQKTLSAGLTAMYPATDITVVNGSSNVIYTTVPNSPINDVNSPETNDHIQHSTLMSPTLINLKDPYGNSFFQQYVCRLALVTVFGYPGAYHVNVDQSYCSRP